MLSVTSWPRHHIPIASLARVSLVGNLKNHAPTLQLTSLHVDASIGPEIPRSLFRRFSHVVSNTGVGKATSLSRSGLGRISRHVSLNLRPFPVVWAPRYPVPRNWFYFPAPNPYRTGPLVTCLSSRDVTSDVSREIPTSSMEKAEDTRADLGAGNAIDFLRLVHNLKTSKRSGWGLKGVSHPESIADHMYRMGTMAIIAGGAEGLDQNKCVKMAIVHDLAEALVGDITPHDGVTKEEKRRLESEAMDEISAKLGSGDAAREIRVLWEEYEANETKEAKLVKDFDKVEMILQALEYEESEALSHKPGQDLDLEEFFESTAGKFQTTTGKAWAAEVLRRRNQKS